MRLPICTSLVMVAAVVMSPVSAADGLHEVTYTVYTDQPFAARIYYRDAEPPDFAEYSHNPYQFSPVVDANIGPANPWILNTKLADPQLWAMVVGTSGQSPTTPNFHCSLAVDGAVVATSEGAKGALCSLRHW